MGQILHGSAKTTTAVCRATQYSQETMSVLARRADQPVESRRQWVSMHDLLALTWQCSLAGVARSRSIYAAHPSAEADEQEWGC